MLNLFFMLDLPYNGAFLFFMLHIFFHESHRNRIAYGASLGFILILDAWASMLFVNCVTKKRCSLGFKTTSSKALLTLLVIYESSLLFFQKRLLFCSLKSLLHLASCLLLLQSPWQQPPSTIYTSSLFILQQIELKLICFFHIEFDLFH